METKFEKLRLFFETIKSIGFWQRIFGWRQVTNLSYDAYKEFNELIDSLDRVIKEADQAKNFNAVLNNDKDHFNSEKIKLESSLESTKEKLATVEKEAADHKASVASYKQTEADRKEKFDNDVAALNKITARIQDERLKEQEDLRKNGIMRFEAMKETWSKHQENVKNVIKMICDRHTIQYLDKVPFKGSPDNTIKLCDEFVIFDAKSPSSDDLQNFPTYIKAQTESVKKYIKEEGVRKDIFLVIPSNTVDVIESFVHNMADYTVYVVTLDVLEPLILSLKKIEDYEFVNQLSPEERENICRIIGKFAHMTKRRIQVDQFFAWEFLDALTKCKADLPKEIFDKVVEFEKNEKLNPPQDRRSKQILDKDLILDGEKIRKEAEAKGIIFPATVKKSLENLPLYDGEKSGAKEEDEV
jgi:hypothetical protein